MKNSKSKRILNIIFIIFIADSVSHLYEILQYNNDENILFMILKISFRVAVIIALLYLIFNGKTKTTSS